MHVYLMHKNGMKLSDYMALKQWNDEDVASALSRDRSNVNRWRRGLTRPDFDALIALERLTGGKVTAKDFGAKGEVAA